MSVEEIRKRIRDNLLTGIKWAIEQGMTEEYLDIHVDKMLEDMVQRYRHCGCFKKEG